MIFFEVNDEGKIVKVTYGNPVSRPAVGIDYTTVGKFTGTYGGNESE